MRHRLTENQRETIFEWSECSNTRRKEAVRESLTKSLAEVLYLRNLPPEESREIVNRALNSEIAESANHRPDAATRPDRRALIRLQTILFSAVSEKTFSRSVNRGVIDSLRWHIKKGQNSEGAEDIFDRIEEEKGAPADEDLRIAKAIATLKGIPNEKVESPDGESWQPFPNRPPKSIKEWWYELARLKRRFAIVRYMRSDTRSKEELEKSRDEIRRANQISLMTDIYKEFDPQRMKSTDENRWSGDEEIAKWSENEKVARDLVREGRKRAKMICFQMNNPQNISNSVIDPIEKYNRHWIELHWDYLKGNLEERSVDWTPDPLPEYYPEPDEVRDPSKLRLKNWWTRQKITVRESHGIEELKYPYSEVAEKQANAKEEPVEYNWDSVDETRTD
ncbi:hypothetical protein [Haloferax sp. Atlit-12N]|uniref:hypothetical protein n=1 Tax=Haloferax sp. Atlit-12N TaxID=2077203 RepID=UPI0011E603C6|nr:hypothetical protein [Haloferax sp. Atlit-12N]